MLSKHFLFNAFENADLDNLLAHARTHSYAANGSIFRKGDPGNGLYGILSGEVAINTFSADGKEILLNLLKPGDIFGEIALLDAKERTAGAMAKTASELLFIDRNDFIPFLERHPQVCVRLLTVLCGRLRWTSQIIEDVIFLDVPGRLAKKLLDFAALHGRKVADGVELDLHLSQYDLGTLTGATRESVNKVLTFWRRNGLISLQQRKIVIHRPAELQSIVDGL
ncbi:MAG TPA: Crp/Fnr family transcriptional regulator [Candidatus Sulfotelmatobacter sp.]|nr:Crp/Fnr family transcriptional regulator [Candidatus Sulfotelmatobacter sp.]